MVYTSAIIQYHVRTCEQTISTQKLPDVKLHKLAAWSTSCKLAGGGGGLLLQVGKAKERKKLPKYSLKLLSLSFKKLS